MIVTIYKHIMHIHDTFLRGCVYVLFLRIRADLIELLTTTRIQQK